MSAGHCVAFLAGSDLSEGFRALAHRIAVLPDILQFIQFLGYGGSIYYKCIVYVERYEVGPVFVVDLDALPLQLGRQG